MKHHSSYKDSGLSFIQKIPEYWSVKKAKYFFKEIDDRSQTGDEELLSVSHITGVTPRSEKNVTMFMAESYEGSKLCRPGDLVINIMWAWMGALGVSKHTGIVSPSYGVYRQKNTQNFDSAYLDYLVRTPEYIAEYRCRSKGIRSSRLRMYSEDFFQISMICPPLDEQKTIVKYVNQKLAEIDQFISYKRRLIELLNEQKTVLINQAVTQGLNPTVPMKPSGIDWLGDIPAHWETILFRRLISRLEQGWSPPCHNQFANLEQWGVLKVSAVNYGIFREEENKALPSELRPIKEYEIKAGDFLVSRANTRSLLGSAVLVENVRPKLLLCDKLYRLSMDLNLVDKEYFVYLMQSQFVRMQIECAAIGSSDSMQNISQEVVKELKVLLPPMKEQAEIVSFIKEESQTIQYGIAQAEKEIELIQEYRTTLISDAVTGKIDVRDRLEAGAAVAVGGVRQ